MKKIAINGFGRIGRLVFRILNDRKDIEVVAINDLSTPEELAYLLKYDTNHGRYDKNVSFDDNNIIVGKKSIKVFSEKEPKNLPWKDLKIDLVMECSGHFTSKEGANEHILAGAKKVLISAPGKDNIKTIVYGVNDDWLRSSDTIVSAASCTTNCLAPVIKTINDRYSIYRGNMTTIHAYTNDQVALDVSHSKGIKERRGRACAMNIIPTKTGAAKAIGDVIPYLHGRINGSAIRVPVSDGSLIDLVVELEWSTNKNEINELFKKVDGEVLHYTEDPIVSSDVIGTTYGAIVDGSLTSVVDGGLVRVVAWYDNEMGYSSQMVRVALEMLKK